MTSVLPTYSAVSVAYDDAYPFVCHNELQLPLAGIIDKALLNWGKLALW